jgi:8-oxo-dGTP pyrophosphatase MutT (NUDIX family)
VDDFEFEEAVSECGADASAQDILLLAAKKGAAREIFEETGLDFRHALDRLDPAPLRAERTDDLCECELKNRLYFYVVAKDEDFPKVFSLQFFESMLYSLH